MSAERQWPAQSVSGGTPFNTNAFRASFQEANSDLFANIRRSKAEGYIHADQLPFGVEAMRGCRVLNLWDGTEGTIETCDSFGRVYARFNGALWPFEGAYVGQLRVLSGPTPREKQRQQRRNR